VLLLLLGLSAPSPVAGQTPATPAAPATGQAARPERIVGEVTATDAAALTLTVKTDDGRTLPVTSDERTTYVRVAPGSTSLEGAAKITRADVGVGDRVLVLLRAGTQGTAWPTLGLARQVIVTSRAELAASRESQREAARRRMLMGRIASIDATRREFTLTTRGRGGPDAGVDTVTVAAGEGVRVLRFAPDSLRPEDARPATLADLRVGDQVRARGERSADGARFTPEEILAGSFVRAAGEITEVKAGEYTVKDELTGKLYTVVFSAKSTLRRVPREVAEEFARRREEQRERMGERRASGEPADRDARREARRAERAARGEGEGRRPDGEGGRRPGGEGGRRREGGPGGNIQQMLEGLPAIAPTDLKKGDALLVTGTPDAAGTRVTAVAAYTGEAEFLRRLNRIQERRGDVNTGLPGDVLGGGNVNREPTTNSPPPPR
ncbi:MAG TPA: hypothetical protein VF240_21875, partial [Pyrinomonadaceae bacterium]